ncbi:MAG: hypothetical protein QOH13_1462 [Thermoleophilaceae bacterium]|jgi:hypothetical protein|nr:hypothetical protein [Thermoleophilaceae bacterium]
MAMAMALALALTAVLGVGVATARVGAAAPRTCSSSRPVFKDGRVKVFKSLGSLDNQRWYLCSAKIHSPKLFKNENQYIEDSEAKFRRFGDRVGYSWVWDDGAGGGWEVGWVDVNTAKARWTFVDFDDVDSEGIDGVAVGPRGGIAYIEHVPGSGGAFSQRIGYAPVRGKLFGKRRHLADVPAGDVDPASLRLSGTKVSWTTTGGMPGEAVIGAAAAGSTPGGRVRRAFSPRGAQASRRRRTGPG